MLPENQKSLLKKPNFSFFIIALSNSPFMQHFNLSHQHSQTAEPSRPTVQTAQPSQPKTAHQRPPLHQLAITHAYALPSQLLKSSTHATGERQRSARASVDGCQRCLCRWCNVETQRDFLLCRFDEIYAGLSDSVQSLPIKITSIPIEVRFRRPSRYIHYSTCFQELCSPD